MARLGFISAEFAGSTIDDVLDSIVRAGGSTVQLDLASAAGTTFPEAMNPDEIEDVRAALAARVIEAAALTGCYNMVHPDKSVRAEGRDRLSSLIRLAPHLGIRVVTLCTGSRSPESMWTAHSDNDSPEAWDDLIAELEHLLPIAESAVARSGARDSEHSELTTQGPPTVG